MTAPRVDTRAPHLADAAAAHLPLKAAPHLALLLLAREPLCGVDLLDRMATESGQTIRLNAGSLYRMLAALVDDGLAERAGEEPSPEGVGAPRKLYGATPLGRAVLAAEARRQAALLEMARSLDLVGEEP